ncbi:MAG TPA: TetR/AcrR family transcriptional regulator [Nocardioides sp.]|uniref:TetR/AcrR family transcriptional regulator n=1 Tax=Nocardioides sp. TaxID=35761 RepID=UPI002E32CF3C|nr:TetR/AcrR family transcriptional regulator [Nocardioides sp.]HEX5089977.1 TetR/AcrR family transcriptional regulator [Nocardioides sp.]
MAESARDRVLDALVSITAERGLDQVSIREVAAEAGVSVGTVQYYCRSKDQMLETAFRHILTRITDRAAATSRSGSVAQALRRALHEFLPLDDLRRRECRVYLAFAARAAVTPGLAEVQHELLGEMRRRCAEVFAAAQESGEVVTDFDPKDAAAVTTALVDGMLLHMLTDPTGLRGTTAVRLLDDHLGRYLDLGAGRATR